MLADWWRQRCRRRRQRVYAAVVTAPLRPYWELARAAGIGRRETRRHLAQLETDGLIRGRLDRPFGWPACYLYRAVEQEVDR